MAYCKSCGNSMKESEDSCKVCGCKLDTLEVVEECEVEIVKHAKSQKQHNNFDWTEELAKNTFNVFDRKILVSLFLILTFSTLAFFVRTVGVEKIIASEIAVMALVAVPLLMILVSCILHKRGLLLGSLCGAALTMGVSATIALATVDVSSNLLIGAAVVEGIVKYAIMSVCITLSVEMLLGKRRLGAHCAFVVVLSIGLLANIIFTLVITPAADMGILVTTWQILSVVSKIMMFCTSIFLFSNLGRIGIKTNF